MTLHLNKMQQAFNAQFRCLDDTSRSALARKQKSFKCLLFLAFTWLLHCEC
jgi:hypothetical protein